MSKQELYYTYRACCMCGAKRTPTLEGPWFSSGKCPVCGSDAMVVLQSKERTNPTITPDDYRKIMQNIWDARKMELKQKGVIYE